MLTKFRKRNALMGRRVISMILALCMIIGAAPVVFPEPARAAAGDLVYDFSLPEKYTFADPGKKYVSEITDFAVSIAEGSAPWKYGGAGDLAGYSAGFEAALPCGWWGGSDGISMYRMGYRSIILRVDTAGNYGATLKVRPYTMPPNKSSDFARVSITPCDENGQTTGDPIVSRPYFTVLQNGTVGINSEISLGKHDFAQGYYLLNFDCSTVANYLVQSLTLGERRALVYDFMALNDVPAGTKLETITDFSRSIAAGSAPFKYGSEVFDSVNQVNIQFLGPTFGLYFYRKGTKNIIIEVDRAGTYDAAIGIITGAAYGSTNVKLTKCNVDGVTEGGVLLDRTYSATDTTAVYPKVPLGRVPLEEGYYQLSLYQGADGKDVRTFVNFFELEGPLPEAAFDVTADTESTVIAGSSSMLDISLIATGVQPIDWNTVSASITGNSAADKATAIGVKGADSVGLEISGLSEGSTVIDYTVSVNGLQYEKSVAVTVLPPVATFEVAADSSISVAAQGLSSTLNISVLKTGTVPVDWGTVSASITGNSAPDKVSVVEIKDEDSLALKISGLSAGAALIGYTVSVNGQQFEKTLTVTVSEPVTGDLFYDFSLPESFVFEDATRKPMYEITSFAASIAEGSAPWKYGGIEDSVAGGNQDSVLPVGWQITTDGFLMYRNGKRNVVIGVESAGMYRAVLDFYPQQVASNSKDAIVDVTLIPCDENGVVTGDELLRVNGFVVFQGGQIKNRFLELGTANLPVGHYLLGLDHRTGNNLACRSLELIEKTFDARMQNATVVSPGENTTAPIKVNTIAGDEIAFDSAVITGFDPAIASVSQGADAKSLAVTGVAEGTTTAQVEISVNGKSQTLPLSITVTKDLNFDLMKGSTGANNIKDGGFDTFDPIENAMVRNGSDPIKLFADTAPNAALAFSGPGLGIWIGLDSNRTVTFMLKVRSSGYYQPVLRMRKAPNLSAAKGTLTKCDADGNRIAVSNNLGLIDCHADALNVVNGAAGVFENKVWLDEGYYLLDLDCIRYDSTRKAVILEGIEFKYIADNALLSFADTDHVINIDSGEQALPLSLYYGTDQNTELVAGSVEFTGYDSRIITPSLSQDGKSIIIQPLVAGMTTLAMTARDSEGLSVEIIWSIQILASASSKTRSSYYTPEKVAALRKNANTYSWVESEKKAKVAAADRYVDMYSQDAIWSLVTTQELPRGAIVGYRNDPKGYHCHYCNKDLRAKYGTANFWNIDTFKNPWKIQCPECKRSFPSNDFASFYKTGIDEQGNWSYERAKENGQQYLKNTLYPEKDRDLGITGWGVDDGYGWHSGNYYTSSLPVMQGEYEEVHTYIAYYNHWGIWHAGKDGAIYNMMINLMDAYLYTGDKKYGRLGAVLVDRIADVYPDMKIRPYFPLFFNSDSTTPHGKAVGCIWEHPLARYSALGYDAFYDMYDDPQVLSFISGKAKQFDLGNAKDAPQKLRSRIEDNLLREIRDAILIGDIRGNFGMQQSCMAYTAVVLDSFPETQEMIDWVFKSGRTGFSQEDMLQEGGNVLATLVDTVTRDGAGAEAGPNYNNIWLGGVDGVMDALAGYDKYSAWDLYQHPKGRKMLTWAYPLTLTRNQTAQIGDSGATAKPELYLRLNTRNFQYSGDIRMAQMLYAMNGNSTEGLHYDKYHPNPPQVQRDVQKIIDTYGEYDFDKSEQAPGYGFSILRGGSLYETPGETRDTQRDFWIYYGKNGGHGHPDTLNLGIEAFGLNMAPDLGYPEAADGAYKNIYWGQATINHNTVMVNQQRMQTNYRAGESGDPLHFDDSGRVKLMDISAPAGYPAASIYRRTVVMVDVDDEVSYGVDFFRVKGGNDHIYSFHSLSDEISETDLNLVKQVGGSYAGADVPWETEGAANQNGLSYLKDVRRAQMTDGSFMVDFKVKDFRNTLENRGQNLHLRMTMVNSFPLTEVAVAKGIPPQRDGNPEELEFVLARRSGSNLDSLFTTVFEPYRDSAYIEEIVNVPVTYENGEAVAAADSVAAVKVTFKDTGRVDYIVYAADNAKTYRVDDKFNFRGFVGMTTWQDGELVYTYGNDSEIVANVSGTAAYTGTVTDFTKDLSFENTISVSFNGAFDPDELIGRYIYVDNKNMHQRRNGAFEIKGVISHTENSAVLDIGDITPIVMMKDSLDMSLGYNYLIGEGQSFRIPLPLEDDDSPVFLGQQGVYTVDAGSQIRFSVNAQSPSGSPLAYRASWLPRGASFSPDSRTLTWIPDSNQVGRQYVMIEATNEKGLTTSQYYEVRVLSATTGKDTEPGSTPGGTPGSTPGGETGGTERFVDLGGYGWAADAINTLADSGVIRGTSESTYSPGANIKRADYAILLVRAFMLTADTTENFADVPSSAYYAKEIAIAREVGIINGVGNNIFNPDNEISREDVMVIAARALAKKGYALEADDAVLKEYSDTGEISGYAREAVAMLVKAGYIKGANGRLNPRGSATRAEIAVILNRILADEK